MHTTRRGTQARQIRDTLLENMISGSNFGILNWDAPTRLPGYANPSTTDVPLASASLITSTIWQTKTKTNLGLDHLPIVISLQMDFTINPMPHRTSFNLKILKAASQHIPSGRRDHTNNKRTSDNNMQTVYGDTGQTLPN